MGEPLAEVALADESLAEIAIWGACLGGAILGI